MKIANATERNRKSGEAEWRDLLFFNHKPLPDESTNPYVIRSEAEGPQFRFG